MLGKPKYKMGDKVEFMIDGQPMEGEIFIVDAYGTFGYPDDVSYDIMGMLGPQECLFKHIPEDCIKPL